MTGLSTASVSGRNIFTRACQECCKHIKCKSPEDFYLLEKRCVVRRKSADISKRRMASIFKAQECENILFACHVVLVISCLALLPWRCRRYFPLRGRFSNRTARGYVLRIGLYLATAVRTSYPTQQILLLPGHPLCVSSGGWGVEYELWAVLALLELLCYCGGYSKLTVTPCYSEDACTRHRNVGLVINQQRPLSANGIVTTELFSSHITTAFISTTLCSFAARLMKFAHIISH